MTFTSDWFNQNWLVALATVLNALLVARQVRSANKRNDFDIWRLALSLMSNRLPKAEIKGENEFYALRHRFVGSDGRVAHDVIPNWGWASYHRSLIQRIEMVHALNYQVFDADLRLVEQVTNALNSVAELFDYGFLDQRKILAKYHVNIIRDLFIVEPYIVHENIFRGRNRWGYRALRLGEIARAYNDMNPVHRRAIYFRRSHGNDTSYGAIYPGPNLILPLVRKMWWLIRRGVLGYPQISERTKRRQNAYFRRIEDETRHLR
jgi:hypothetical protein